MILWGLLLPALTFSVEWSNDIPQAHEHDDRAQSCSLEPLVESCSELDSSVDPDAEYWTPEADDRGWGRV
jgi:hypothetical protein